MTTSETVTLLRLRAVSKVLDVEWADGTRVELPYGVLRARCPCAGCRQSRRTTGELQPAGQVDVTAIVPCGPNAVQLAFSDGHQRGIFPFPYLRELGEETRPADVGISK